MIRRTLVQTLLVFCAAAGPAAAADSGALDRIFAGKVAGETASFLVVLRQQAEGSLSRYGAPFWSRDPSPSLRSVRMTSGRAASG